MISIDLHTHTSHSHGKATVQEMFDAGRRNGLAVHGFSEHSPRPVGFNYPTDYREKLTQGFPLYVEQVRTLAQEHAAECTVLLGLEMDWFPSQVDFIRETISQYDYDYVIGGIHFLDTWGFDFTPDDWEHIDSASLADIYTRYFASMEAMAASGLFQIAAHPDIIKIFTVDTFHTWLATPEGNASVRKALEALRQADMAMEISSAGLRKPCKEIYPCPTIMEMAVELGLPITFGSDAHCINTIGWGFNELEAYARNFGYTESACFKQKIRSSRPF